MVFRFLIFTTVCQAKRVKPVLTNQENMFSLFNQSGAIQKSMMTMTTARAAHRLHVLPGLVPVTCITVLGAGSLVACFSCLAPVSVVSFPALDTACMLSRAWHRLHIFTRLVSVASVPALGPCYMFSRTWRRLHVFVLKINCTTGDLTDASTTLAILRSQLLSKLPKRQSSHQQLTFPGYLAHHAK